MNEPKKYTAKEAMHWMIDHQGEQMVLIEPVDGARLYLYKFTNLRFGGSLNGFGWAEVGSDFLSDKLSATIYVRTEYDAWQAALKAEEQAQLNKEAQEALNELLAEKAKESEPREGESIKEYIRRVSVPARPPAIDVHDALQIWIESYVRREIAKAMEAK